jgi:shikimate dehydrogenase
LTAHYAVIGNPVQHSKSPFIHKMFARQTGQDLDYSRILAEPGHFSAAVRQFLATGGKGLNVTVPFKQEAFALADRCSPEAKLAGAVNTLVWDGAQLQGHNTDGIGLVRDILQNLGSSLAGLSVLVLGAGGATRGILQPLLEQRPAALLIANRTVARAEELVANFAGLGPIAACSFQDVPAQPFDWIINATSASLQGETPPLPAAIIDRKSSSYDLMYGAKPTPFMVWCRAQGAVLVADGLGMLVEQAAESFLLWRGMRPATGDVIRALRAQLAAA